MIKNTDSKRDIAIKVGGLLTMVVVFFGISKFADWMGAGKVSFYYGVLGSMFVFFAALLWVHPSRHSINKKKFFFVAVLPSIVILAGLQLNFGIYSFLAGFVILYGSEFAFKRIDIKVVGKGEQA